MPIRFFDDVVLVKPPLPPFFEFSSTNAPSLGNKKKVANPTPSVTAGRAEKKKIGSKTLQHLLYKPKAHEDYKDLFWQVVRVPAPHEG